MTEITPTPPITTTERVGILEAVLDERAKALALQHKELERRLSVLNHAHENAVEVQRNYVREDKFSDFVKRFEEHRDIVLKALTLTEGGTQRGREMSTATFAWITITIVVIANIVSTLIAVL